MKPSSGSDDEEPPKSSNTSIALGACLITLGSKPRKTKGSVGAVVAGSVAVAIGSSIKYASEGRKADWQLGSGALESVAVEATILATGFTTSLNVAYSNADTMNQFEG
ncbi:hypothetical protein FSARC_2946 [Fusarium sarcochroum]|uniref:Uncharacterized protein n=1 Tax=Fusarium sarcochroum TaxID=1208366 RepID=A0A8H4U528_9HYPO|nr:hypothetical protein FSARC_2946 [Fusarium sarcochroum]